MRSIILFAFALILTCAFFGMNVAEAQTVDDLLLMTEAYPPLNFVQDGQLQGISVDLMARMLEMLHAKTTRADIAILPWARAYKNLQTKANTCLFAMMRTPEREPLFKWVGPIAPSRVVLTAPKYKQVKIQSVQDLKKYRVGVVIDDIGEQTLVEQGLDKGTFVASSTPDLCANQLEKGRIDLWAYDELVTKWVLKKQGFDPADYETVYVLKSGEYFIAFHNDTPDALIRHFQQALDDLNVAGEVRKITEAYSK